MGTVSRSMLFKSDQTQPMSTVLISSGGNPTPKISAMCDTANLKPGLLCTRTATSYPTEMTEAGALFGSASEGNALFIVELEADTPYQNGQYVLETAYADLDPITVYELKPGMEVWCKGSSLTCEMGDILVPAASGLVTNVGDPDGVAIEKTAHGFMALASLISGTWIPVRYLGKVVFDNTP